MATLLEQVNRQLADIDAAIQRIQDNADAQIRALKGKQQALGRAVKALTPEIEQAVVELRALDLLKLE